MMEAVDAVNEAQKQVLVRQDPATTSAAKLQGKTIAVWGLAFKPRTDDIREAPALVLIDALLAAGRRLRVHDPEAMANVRAIYGDKLVYCDRPYGALEGADALAIVTEWNEFRNPDFEVMRAPAERPGHLRRPQPLRPGADGRAGVHLPRHRPCPRPCPGGHRRWTPGATREATTRSSTSCILAREHPRLRPGGRSPGPKARDLGPRCRCQAIAIP